jgi:hypothetical protein
VSTSLVNHRLKVTAPYLRSTHLDSSERWATLGDPKTTLSHTTFQIQVSQEGAPQDSSQVPCSFVAQLMEGLRP